MHADSHGTRLRLLARLLAAEHGFHYVPDEPPLIAEEARYFDEVANIRQFLANGGRIQGLAQTITGASLAEHPASNLLQQSSSYYMTQGSITPTSLTTLTIALCPPLSYVWYIAIKLKRVTEHIGEPIYAPRFIKVYLTPTPQLRPFVYESQPFLLGNSTATQTLALPPNISGALYAQIVLCGARQACPNDNQFYVAIESLEVFGVAVNHLAAAAMRALEVSRVTTRMSRTSSVTLRPTVDRHVSNVCRILAHTNTRDYIQATSGSRNKPSLSSSRGPGSDVTRSEEGNLPLGIVARKGLLPMDFADTPHIAFARYSANSIKWIENTLSYIAMEAYQFLCRRGRQSPSLSNEELYAEPRVEPNLNFLQRWRST